jgi:ParB family chromosome partitioning protein
MAKLDTVAIDSIKVGSRHRKEMGDVTDLADSIDSLGLLHPIVVRDDLILVAGARRLAALKQLGRIDAPVHIVSNLQDAMPLLQAERDENTCRKDLTPGEAAALGAQLEKLERPEAKKRQGTRTDLPEHSGNLPESSKGDTRDMVAAAVGLSGRTYEKAKEVVAAAQEPDAPEEVKEAAAEMERTGKVDPAHKKVKAAKAKAKKPRADPREDEGLRGPYRKLERKLSKVLGEGDPRRAEIEEVIRHRGELDHDHITNLAVTLEKLSGRCRDLANSLRGLQTTNTTNPTPE